MSHPLKNNNSNISQKSLRRWHRWVGYTSLFFVLILSITGLILNRSERLNLNQTMIQSDFISSLYGLSPSAPPIHFKTGKHWVSWLDGRVYMDGKLFSRDTKRLVGGAVLDDMIIVGTKDSISLYLKDGPLLETLDSSSLPGSIIAIGQTAKNNIFIVTEGGNYTTDDDFMSWQKTMDSHNIPSGPTVPSQHITDKIMQDYKGQGVTLSRLILDLHSGNIMGSFGSYVMDLAALSLIFLGATGFMKRKRTDKDKRRANKDRRKNT